jgi:hypothetical protein
MAKAAIAGSAVLVTMILPGVAGAGPLLCGPRNDVLAKLSDSRHEQPSSVALTNDGQLLEVLKSDTDLSWTMLITSPQGLSCVVAEGDGWQTKQMDRFVQDPQT